MSAFNVETQVLVAFLMLCHKENHFMKKSRLMFNFGFHVFSVENLDKLLSGIHLF